MEKYAIEVKDLTKKYTLYNNNKEKFMDLVTNKEYGVDFLALDKITFNVPAGEVLGFVGTNGSGKSTLSNIIAGIVPETNGYVITRGEVALIAVSAGLDSNLTGRENIELKLLMLGFDKENIENLEADIIGFSELGEFIDQPVKSYSSGMRSRLGFAISVNVDPDILIIDEALSVGDKAFATKSLKKINEFKSQGKTMIFVSHSLNQMKSFCTKILWLEYGRLKMYGETDEVLTEYDNFIKKWQLLDEKSRRIYKESVQETSVGSHIDIESFIDKDSNFNKILKSPVSKIAHIRAGKSKYFSDINSKEGLNTRRLKNSVYYILRKADYRGLSYYLLSTKKSVKSGVVGWIESKHLSLHDFLLVDKDEKKGSLNGKGKGYTMPWGGENQIVLNSLSQFEGKQVIILKTVLVGKNIWYEVKLESYTVWIHSKWLEI